MPVTAGQEEQNASASQTTTQHPGPQVTQGFSHLASTVPDSQGFQQFDDISPSFRPLAPAAAHSHLDGNRPLKIMTNQSSPHDTQELSPSYYASLINVRKSKIVLGPSEGGQSQDDDDGVTQHTIHTGEPGYVDLGLSDGGDEQEVQADSDAQLDSEPIAFSPTQATQHRLSQLHESQRYKTPATSGKKRNCLGEVVESPALPRNPLAPNGIIKTPMRALGLSQAFAATQAGSSPLMARHISEPASDRPSPNIQLQARPATASFSSPLRPRSELGKIWTEPQTRYVSIKESQAERDRQAVLREQSSDGIAADEQSDDDFDDEASIVKHVRRVREREEFVRERFVSFSSLARPASAATAGKLSASAVQADASSPVQGYSRQAGPPPIEESHAPVVQGPATCESEDETEVEEEHRVVIRHSSQLTHTTEDEDKENVQARALHVPETVARLHQVISGQGGGDTSPTLRRSAVQPPLEPLNRSQTIRQGIVNMVGLDGSPTVAVANSQPDQPLSRKLVSDLVEPSNAILGSSHVSSSAAVATQIESSPCRDEGRYHKPGINPHVIEDITAGEQQYQGVIESSGDGSRNNEASFGPPRRQIQEISYMRTDDIRRVGPPSTVTGLLSTGGSTTNIAKNSSDKTTSTNGVNIGQPSNTSETAQAQLSSRKPASRRLNPLFSSPTGKKRRRLGDIASQPSPKRMRGETEVEEVMAAINDAEFYNAIEMGPASTSPIPSGRNVKGRRLTDRPPLSGPTSSADKDSHLLSSPPTRDPLTASRIHDQVRSVSRLRTDRIPPRRSTAIWDVLKTPPKSATASSAKTAAIGLRELSGKHSHPLPSKFAKRKESKVIEAPQNDANEKRRPIASSNQPRETTITIHIPRRRSTGIVAPNQVLAFFNGNRRGYYPATCVGSTGSKSEGTVRYQIQWDDASRDEIDELGIRRFDLRVGDQVKVNLHNWPRVSYVVQGFRDRVEKVDGKMTDIRGFRTLLVKPKKRKSLPAGLSPESVKEVPMYAIYLDTNMWGQMKDRMFNSHVAAEMTPLNLDVLQQAPSQSGLSTPSERPSTPSSPSSRTRRRADVTVQTASTAVSFPAPPTASGIFSNMAFAVSYDDSLRKTSLVKAISANGGTLLGEDFHELFERQATPTSPSRRKSRTDLLTLNTRFSNTGFVALIADRHTRKPKYMQALALGIPTLSGKWVEACVIAKTILSWQSYLLAAGESLELEGAVRSRALGPIDANAVLLRDMISTRPNLLHGEAVIVVKGRGKAEKKRKPYIFLAEAAGAGRVETCVSLKNAKMVLDKDSEDTFRWVFVDDKEVDKAEAALLPQSKGGKARDLKVVGNEFLCQSLILGRLWGHA